MVSGSVELSVHGKKVFRAKPGTMISVPRLHKIVNPTTGSTIAEISKDAQQTSLGHLEVRATTNSRLLVWKVDALLKFLEKDEAAYVEGQSFDGSARGGALGWRGGVLVPGGRGGPSWRGASGRQGWRGGFPSPPLLPPPAPPPPSSSHPPPHDHPTTPPPHHHHHPTTPAG